MNLYGMTSEELNDLIDDLLEKEETEELDEVDQEMLDTAMDILEDRDDS